MVVNPLYGESIDFNSSDQLPEGVVKSTGNLTAITRKDLCHHCTCLVCSPHGTLGVVDLETKGTFGEANGNSETHRPILWNTKLPTRLPQP